MSQNNEETAECGAGRKELRELWAWGIACRMHKFNKQQFIFALKVTQMAR